MLVITESMRKCKTSIVIVSDFFLYVQKLSYEEAGIKKKKGIMVTTVKNLEVKRK